MQSFDTAAAVTAVSDGPPALVDVAPAWSRSGAFVLNTFIDAVSWEGATNSIIGWAQSRQSRSVYFCNVHSLVTAREDEVLHKALSQGDLLTPDGMPVAWMLRRSGHASQERVCGPDLMPKILRAAETAGISVFFFGDEQGTLDTLRQVLSRDYPNLNVAGMISPPFRDLSKEEDDAVLHEINSSGAQLVFVSLGCPKQEKWIADHKGRIHATMLGVGAAFNFFAGIKRRAPIWMQKIALEWLYRLAAEPRRLAKRYLYSNSAFVLFLMQDVITGKSRKFR